MGNDKEQESLGRSIEQVREGGKKKEKLVSFLESDSEKKLEHSQSAVDRDLTKRKIDLALSWIQHSVNKMFVAFFGFTKIQCREHKIAKANSTEWKESSSTKTSLNVLLTFLSHVYI